MQKLCFRRFPSFRFFALSCLTFLPITNPTPSHADGESIEQIQAVDWFSRSGIEITTRTSILSQSEMTSVSTSVNSPNVGNPDPGTITSGSLQVGIFPELRVAGPGTLPPEVSQTTTGTIIEASRAKSTLANEATHDLYVNTGSSNWVLAARLSNENNSRRFLLDTAQAGEIDAQRLKVRFGQDETEEMQFGNPLTSLLYLDFEEDNIESLPFALAGATSQLIWAWFGINSQAAQLLAPPASLNGNFSISYQGAAYRHLIAAGSVNPNRLADGVLVAVGRNEAVFQYETLANGTPYYSIGTSSAVNGDYGIGCNFTVNKQRVLDKLEFEGELLYAANGNHVYPSNLSTSLFAKGVDVRIGDQQNPRTQSNAVDIIFPVLTGSSRGTDEAAMVISQLGVTPQNTPVYKFSFTKSALDTISTILKYEFPTTSLASTVISFDIKALANDAYASIYTTDTSPGYNYQRAGKSNTCFAYDGGTQTPLSTLSSAGSVYSMTLATVGPDESLIQGGSEPLSSEAFKLLQKSGLASEFEPVPQDLAYEQLKELAHSTENR